MAETLAGTATFTLQPQIGGIAVKKISTVIPEIHGMSLRREVTIPAATTNFPILLSDFATIAWLILEGDTPFTFKLGTTGNEARSCRQFAVEMPNNLAIAALYITTTTQILHLDLTVAGD